MTTPSPTQVVLIRHPRTTWNDLSRYQGRLDSPLSLEGEAQLALIATLVSPGTFDAVYSSPLTRARSLAVAIADRAELSVRIDDRLAEIDMGDWQGLYRSEIDQRFPGMLDRWEDQPDKLRFPNGENLTDVAERTKLFLEALFVGDDRRVAVVTHNAVVKVAAMMALQMPFRHLHHFRVHNGSLTILRGYALPASLDTLDATMHLTGSAFLVSEPENEKRTAIQSL